MTLSSTRRLLLQDVATSLRTNDCIFDVTGWYYLSPGPRAKAESNSQYSGSVIFLSFDTVFKIVWAIHKTTCFQLVPSVFNSTAERLRFLWFMSFFDKYNLFQRMTSTDTKTNEALVVVSCDCYTTYLLDGAIYSSRLLSRQRLRLRPRIRKGLVAVA